MRRETLALAGLGLLLAAPRLLALETDPVAARPAQAAQAAAPQSPASAAARGGRAGGAPGRGGHGRERLQGRVEADRRSGHDERRDERAARVAAGPEHGRHAALGAGHERDPDVGARHQPDRAPGDLDARDLAARLGRRSLGLPRLLRARALGPRAVSELRRDQADRGGARSGLGRVGGERGERRRQHHHQDAARERGPRARAERRAVQPRRGLAQGRRRRLPVERQLLLRARHQRQLVLPAERRLLPVRPVLPPDRHDPARLSPVRSGSLSHRERRDRRREAFRSVAPPTRPTGISSASSRTRAPSSRRSGCASTRSSRTGAA